MPKTNERSAGMKGTKYPHDGREIFTSSKARKAVSYAIYKEILKGLKGIEVKVRL